MGQPQAPGTVALLRPEARDLPAYNAGVAASAVMARYGLARVSALASNENPFGTSADVTRSLQGLAGAISRYPDPRCSALRERLAARTGVAPERLVLGNGSEDIIQMICLATLSPGDRVVTLAPAFGLHEIFARMMGALVDKVPLSSGFAHDLPAWCAALAHPAKIVMLSSPSNPVGCVLDSAQLRQMVAAAPHDCLIVIDEAYYEYALGPGYADSIAVLSEQARPWIVLRTFSKAYGLAGLRVGYGVASDAALVDVLDRVRTPFHVNIAAQLAAVAALDDQDHLDRVVAQTAQERARLLEELLQLERRCCVGLRVAPSRGNFLFVDTRSPGVAIAESLMQAGVIVKPWRERGFETFIRVSIGTCADNAHFVTVLASVLAGAPERAGVAHGGVA